MWLAEFSPELASPDVLYGNATQPLQLFSGIPSHLDNRGDLLF